MMSSSIFQNGSSGECARMSLSRDAEIKQLLREFVLSSTNIGQVNDDDDLFESGIVNSLFAVQWMTFIENTFGIEIDVDDLDIQNFKSLNAATAFVLKRNGTPRIETAK